VKDKGHKMESCLTWHECNIEDYISHYEVWLPGTLLSQLRCQNSVSIG
jgi:hypothetical protein